MAIYLNIFPSILRNSFDCKNIVCTGDILHIDESLDFLKCQEILEKVLFIQKDHICAAFPNFSSDLIPSYLRYFKLEKILVALVYISKDGKIAKKYRVSKIPYLCGDKDDVDRICQVFKEPINCLVTLTRDGFNSLNGNRKFTQENEKECQVSVKTYLDFVSISGFIKKDIKDVERRLYILLGVNALTSEYVASTKVTIGFLSNIFLNNIPNTDLCMIYEAI